MNTVRNPDQTRLRLIEAAFDEIYANGYQGMRIDDILNGTGLKKGALYHHFAGKTELAYAVLDELIEKEIEQMWIEPLKQFEDPIEGIRQMIIEARDHPKQDYVKCGCPLNNLAQEMSPIDEAFRIKIQRLFQLWIDTFANKLKQGQQNGTVAKDIDALSAATFIVASLEGTMSLIKASQDPATLDHCWFGIERFLYSLRPS